jgi:hypothetical protein
LANIDRQIAELERTKQLIVSATETRGMPAKPRKSRSKRAPDAPKAE